MSVSITFVGFKTCLQVLQHCRECGDMVGGLSALILMNSMLQGSSVTSDTRANTVIQFLPHHPFLGSPAFRNELSSCEEA